MVRRSKTTCYVSDPFDGKYRVRVRLLLVYSKQKLWFRTKNCITCFTFEDTLLEFHPIRSATNARTLAGKLNGGYSRVQGISFDRQVSKKNSGFEISIIVTGFPSNFTTPIPST